MDQDLKQRVAQLENRLNEVQRQLDEERAEEARRRRRESWFRIALVLVIALFYVAYFRGLASL